MLGNIKVILSKDLRIQNLILTFLDCLNVGRQSKVTTREVFIKSDDTSVDDDEFSR